MSDTKYLYKCLRLLPDTGPSGLEGLVRDLLEQWTGQRFLLAKSGSQSGRDTRSEQLHGNMIAVESKNYEGKSRLAPRGLAGELLQAAVNLDLDLWVLVATKEVSDQDAEALQKGADLLGFEVLVIDARNESLGYIDVFFSEYLDRTVAFCVANAKDINRQRLAQELENVRRNTIYQRVAVLLRNTLSTVALGYDDAREQASKWLSDQLKTRSQSKATLGQDIGLSEPTRQAPIQRIEIENTLNTWRQNGAKRCPHLALLGEEGTGKTWAVFSWLHTLVGDAHSPIILPVTSTGLPFDGDLALLIADALHHRCGKTPTFWGRRLKSWQKRVGQVNPQFLLVFDGLNERPDFPWQRLFSAARGDDWLGRLAILVTCRPDFWHNSLSGIESTDFQLLTTEGYTDAELVKALATYHLSLEQIPSKLRPLIRKPRFCDLVARHFHEMVQSGDLTVDRLLYEDYKDRRLRKDGLPITDDAFRQILGSVARRYRERSSGFNRAEIRSFLPEEDLSGSILQEIIDGGLFERGNQQSTPYRVERRRLIHGLGMLLADELYERGDASQDEFADAVDAWHEPQSDIDIKTAICGAAVFYSLATPSYPTAARRALLAWWIGARNMPAEEAREPAYVPRCPADFLAITEQFWQVKQENHLAQERLANAYRKYRDHTEVQPLLIAAMQRWMGFVHVHGQPLQRGPQNKHVNQIADVIRDRLGISVTSGEITFHGIPLTVIEDDGLLRLARFALLVISAGDREPFVEAFIRWAVSRQVMGMALEADEVAWVLRLTDEELWPLFQPRLTHLGTSYNDTLKKAAYELLTCLGTQEALSFRETTLQGIHPPNAWWIKHEQDPCTSFFAWARNECEPCLQRDDIPMHQLVSKLQPFAADPSLGAPESFVRRLIAEANTLPAAECWSRAGRTDMDLQFETLESALARFVPTVLADFVRAVVRTLPSRPAESAQVLFMYFLPEVAFILHDPELEILKATLGSLITEAGAKERSEDISAYEHRVEAYGSLALAMHLPPDALIAYLVKRPLEAENLLLFEYWFSPLLPHVTMQFFEQLQNETHPVKLFRLLWCLGSKPLTLAKEQRARVAELLEHPDISIRLMAARLAYLSEDRVLCDHVLQNGRRFNDESDSLESLWGSRILCHYGAGLSYTDLVDRLSLERLGFAIVERGCRNEEVEQYAHYLDAIWHGIALANNALGPLSRRQFRQFSSEALRAIYLSSPDLVYGWVEAVLDETRRAHTILHRCDDFYAMLCAMLVSEEPGLGFRLWRRLRARGIGLFSALPFFARESNEAQQERSKMLEACCNDLSLLDLATIATTHKRMDWLIEQARQLIAMGPLWRQAKGIALACLADVAVDELDQLINVAHISGTWIDSLLLSLRAYHDRNQWAKHWYKKFLTESDRDASWAAFRLFLRCVDRRCWLWIDLMEQECGGITAFDQTRVQFRLTNSQKIKQAIDHNEQNLKECFLTLKFQDQAIFPFMRAALTTHI